VNTIFKIYRKIELSSSEVKFPTHDCNLLTPWCRILFEKLNVTQLV
jgi:hypothetical protein